MSNLPNHFVTPAGRIVGGSLSVAQTTGYENKVLDTPKWVIMLALPKSDKGTQPLVDKIKAVGAEGFKDTPGLLRRPDFAWKIIDGDSAEVNQRGVAHNTREGYPGHYVLTFSTPFAFETCGEDPNVLIPAESVLKGHWIRVCGKVKANGNSEKPGVYLDLSTAQFMRKDVEIVSANNVSAASAFGGADTAWRADTTAAPPAPQHSITSVATGAPPPPPPPAAGPPPRPDGLVLTALGVSQGVAIDDYLAKGWTSANLKERGIVE